MQKPEQDHAPDVSSAVERGVRLPDCRRCANWFLGCLNGREKWADDAVRPNFRYAGQSGAEYTDYDKAPGADRPLRRVCDAFEWHPDPEVQGRVIR